ncbi:MAG: discoidin domain-containing protein, partial [Crenarchaeota archaeon]|nr:discoidin domain-containing protein [Thermoproteota archaeon]
IPYWISAIDDPDPWIAFKFNTLTEFDWCYIRSLLFGMYGSTEYYTTGGDIYASLDSTNGIDGSWRLLREDIFNINYDDYDYMIESLYVPICSVDPVEPEESTPAH